MSTVTTFRYTSGSAAGNLYMTMDGGEYALTLDWSFDAIYFKSPHNNKWYTLGTGKKTIVFEWACMNEQEQYACINMLLHAKLHHSSDYAQVKADQMLQSHHMMIHTTPTDTDTPITTPANTPVTTPANTRASSCVYSEDICLNPKSYT